MTLFKRDIRIGLALLAVAAVLGVVSFLLDRTAGVEAAAVMAPRFEVDPLWPKPLPNHWLLGTVIGVDIDEEDNVWIIHRGSSLEPKEVYATWDPPASTCCYPAPPVLVFNSDGDLLRHWGGPGEGYSWPASNHGIDVDHKGNVWIGGNGRGQRPADAKLPHDESAMGQGAVHDSMVLKFSKSGKFLMQLGKPFEGTGSNDLKNFKLPAKTLVDPKTNELYVADGYGNRRVIVFDADTGAYKRHWGAYGKKPDDADPGPYDPAAPIPQVFRTVHCAQIANDGLVYVCDRANDRIQVFRKDGTFVKETQVAKNTLGDGVVFDMAFSNDKPQRHLFIADGANHRVWTLLRDPLQVVSHFGSGGRYPGQFYAVHNISLDSKGNVYTVETYEGKRLQKFNYKGIGAVAATTN
jgi:hypothetical protein